MRILYVIDSVGVSGAEHSTAALLPVLRDLGHDVAVATLYDAGYGDEEDLRSRGFSITPLSSRRFWNRVAELRQRIREFRPDVVHTALFNSDMVGRFACALGGPPVVSSFVNTPYDPARLRDPGITPWRLRTVRIVDGVSARLLVDHFHAVSPGVAQSNAQALHLPTDRVTVVERGRSRSEQGWVSAARRGRTRSTLGLSERAKVVLCVGRQEHHKAQVDLLKAVESLAASVPELVVLLAGRQGGASAGLHMYLDAHPRVAERTILLGHRHDVPDLLVAADVLAIPSWFEGTAGVAIEAMSLDCPIVCTDIVGVRGILDHEVNALLVPVGAPDELASALRRVILDAPLADTLRANGAGDFERRFTIERSAAALLALYRDVLSGSDEANSG